MGAPCRQKGRESGLWYEKKCLEDLVASSTISDKERAFAKKILKSYKKLSEGDYRKPVD